MSNHAIMPLAVTGWIVGLWSMFGWGVGVGVGLATLFAINEHRIARQNKEWRERWEVREARWNAGERPLK